MSKLNPAVRDHLRRIADAERNKTLRWLLRLRAFSVTCYLLTVLYYVVIEPRPEGQVSLHIFVAYSAIATLFALAAELWPKVLRFAGYSLGLLDIPLISGVVYLIAPVVPHTDYLLNSFLPFTAALIMLSVLALDYGAIVVVTLSATVATVITVRSVGAPLIEAEDPALAMVLIGTLSAFIVSRLRALVEESRRKDFAGKYVLGERLGVGGMAEVFEATYSPEGSFERRVAVKRILPAYAGNEDFVALFRREAELGSLLAHPNLVQVLDFGRHLDSWFIAMELVEGVSVADWLRAHHGRAQLPIDACLYVMAEVAEGLTYLHEKPSSDGAHVGLVHRDVNPPNVLISKTGEVKVSDFGVTRWSSSAQMTAIGTVRGKVTSMAPEHLRGAPPTPGGDLFALGVLAFEMLTGRRLFRGETDVEVAKAVLEQPMVAVSTLRPDVPAGIDELIAGLLERDPAKRLSSARLVTTRLRAVEGPLAPYPMGRRTLIQSIDGLRVRSAAAARTPSAPLEQTSEMAATESHGP